MFCPKCGTRVEEGHPFCPMCGARIFDINTTASNPQIPVPPEVKPLNYDSVKAEYDKFLNSSEKKQKKTIEKLNSKQKKASNRSAKTIIKHAAVRLLVAILIFALTSSLTVGVFSYAEGIDMPGFAYTVMDTLGLVKEDESQGKKPEPDADKNDAPETPQETDEPESDPISDENREVIERYNARCNEIASAVNSNIAKVGQEDEDGYIEYETEMDALSDTAWELYCDDEIEDYEINDNNAVFYFENGEIFVYMLHEDGLLADGGAVSVSIGTYEPCITDDLGASTADESAEAVANEFDNISFDCNYDDDEVNFDVISKLGENKIICWQGHGGYSSDCGPFISTGIRTSGNIAEDIPNSYVRYYYSGDIFMVHTSEGLGYYAVSIDFLESVIPDNALEGSIIFLGTCDSCKDSRLANALIDKGALAVLGFSDTVHTNYCDNISKAFFTRLAQENNSGVHYSLTEALSYAKDKCGEIDKVSTHWWSWPVETELLMYTDYPGYTLDAVRDVGTDRNVVLLLDVSSSMAGEPLEELKVAANEFIQTIEDSGKDVGISLVTFSDEAYLICDYTKNYDYLRSCVASLDYDSSTNMEDGLLTAQRLLSAANLTKNCVVLMSDGEPTSGGGDSEIISVADEIKENEDNRIYTLGFFSSLDDSTHAKQLLDAIASDGCHYEVSDAEDMQFFFEEIASEVSGATNYMCITIDCPADITVSLANETMSSKGETDSVRSSFGSITFQGESEDGGADTRTKILRLKSENIYDIYINVNGTGIMNYSIQFMDENGEYSDVRVFKGIRVDRFTVARTTAEISNESVLEIDEDGDGDADRTYVAGVNGTARLRDYSAFNTILICCAAVTAAGMLTADVLRIVKTKKSGLMLALLKEKGFV